MSIVPNPKPKKSVETDTDSSTAQITVEVEDYSRCESSQVSSGLRLSFNNLVVEFLQLDS